MKPLKTGDGSLSYGNANGELVAMEDWKEEVLVRGVFQ